MDWNQLEPAGLEAEVQGIGYAVPSVVDHRRAAARRGMHWDANGPWDAMGHGIGDGL